MRERDKYYEVLGLKNTATLDEVKRAYRGLAKKYHPDVNKSPGAQQQFILITEAYDFILNQNSSGAAHNYQYDSDERIKQQQKEAQERAAAYSQMKYEEFVNSTYYKTISSIDTIFDHLFFFGALLIVVVLPLLLYLLFDGTGLVMGGIIIFITLPFTAKALRRRPVASLRLLVKAIFVLFKWRPFQVLLVAALTVIVFLKIGFQTLVPTYLLGTIFFISPPLLFFILKKMWRITKRTRSLYSLLLLPMAINLFFCVNYFFSQNPLVENYEYTKNLQSKERRPGKNVFSSVNLKDDRYSAYPGLTVFFNFEELEQYNRVSFTFEDGLFGMRVLKDYNFY